MILRTRTYFKTEINVKVCKIHAKASLSLTPLIKI